MNLKNISLDKYVDLDKKYVMKCLYLPNFKFGNLLVVSQKFPKNEKSYFIKK